MSNNPQLGELLHTIEDLIIENKIQEAIDLIEARMSEFESYYEIFNSLSELYLMMDNPQTSLSHLQRALELAPENLDTLELMGDTYFALMNFEVAEISWKKVTEADPKRFNIWFKLGELYYQTGEYVKATQSLLNYLEYEEDALVLSLLASIYQKMGNEIECWNNLMRAEKLTPTNVKILNQIGEVYFDLDNFDRAEEYFRKASEANPSSIPAWFHLGKTYEAKQDFAQSIQAFVKVLEIDPDNVLGYYYLAKIYAADANIAEAITNYEECLKRDPSFEDASLSLASLYWASKNNEKALTYLQESLRYNPESSKLFQMIGDIYEDLGEMEKALNSWEQASKLEEG
ncbi:MAG: tetratricopeptide repeat protein [Candidatus Heimdallarchaeaceae archaeon]|jgi:tetratricopeptide (TPR) repeat protein